MKQSSVLFYRHVGAGYYRKKNAGRARGISVYQVLAEMITAACIKAKESSGRDKVALKRWRIAKPVTAAFDRN